MLRDVTKCFIIHLKLSQSTAVDILFISKGTQLLIFRMAFNLSTANIVMGRVIAILAGTPTFGLKKDGMRCWSASVVS